MSSGPRSPLPSRTRARLGRAARVAVWLSRVLVLTTLLWQGFLIELVDDHDDTAHCEDDDGTDCDCPPNCHCCLDCAHQGTPALPTVFAPRPLRLLDFAVLDDPRDAAWLESADRGPPLKVPKPSHV